MTVDIPGYPNFRPLELRDLNYFRDAFRDNPPDISEFTFTNLYAWRAAYGFEVSLLDGMIILRSTADKQLKFFPPIGRGDFKKVVLRVLNEFECIFIRIPEEIKTLFDKDEFYKIDYDRDNSDYLYKIDNLVALSGAKYDGKRNLIKKFNINHEFEYVKLNSLNAAECLGFEDNWCTIKNCDAVEGLAQERSAIREMINNFSIFELIGGMIKVTGKIYAVAIAQKLNPRTLVMHILKADPGFVGLYQLINNEFLKHEGSGFEYVNFEEDMGVEGLRKAKLSYHPERFINKYKIGLA